MRDTVQLFKALADETRLKMLALLIKHDELCVCDFEGGLGISQSRASRHLRTLYSAGLIEDRREAVWVYYRLSRKQDSARKAVMKSVEKLLENGPGTLPRNIRDTMAQFDQWLKNNSCQRAGE
ncbi:MAG: hypothetical protein A2X94_13820 [Bdellovibrionales bacterium GWB1_55_8]|nr:MAG: hypothetical protein A2X94_13820 [Bdellovibrionales bacterium GWB1_55_8]